MSLQQHGTQAKSSNQVKTTFYQVPVWLPIPEDNKQTFSTNRLCSGLSSHLSKLVVCYRNKKVGKSGKEINNILYFLLTIFLIIKVKVGLSLHFFLFHLNWVSVLQIIFKTSRSGWSGKSKSPWSYQIIGSQIKIFWLLIFCVILCYICHTWNFVISKLYLCYSYTCILYIVSFYKKIY